MNVIDFLYRIHDYVYPSDYMTHWETSRLRQIKQSCDFVKKVLENPANQVCHYPAMRNLVNNVRLNMIPTTGSTEFLHEANKLLDYLETKLDMESLPNDYNLPD